MPCATFITFEKTLLTIPLNYNSEIEAYVLIYRMLKVAKVFWENCYRRLVQWQEGERQ